MGDSDGGAKGGGVHFWLQGRLEGGILGGIRVLSLRLGSLCRVWAGGGGGFPGLGCRIVFRRGLLCFVLILYCALTFSDSSSLGLIYCIYLAICL